MAVVIVDEIRVMAAYFVGVAGTARIRRDVSSIFAYYSNAAINGLNFIVSLYDGPVV